MRRRRAPISVPPAVGRFWRRWVRPLYNLPIPRGAGVAASTVFLSGAMLLAVTHGGHVPVVWAHFTDARDTVANAFGFRITSIALAGGKQMTREEILTTAGVTGRTSLLFLDAREARSRLKANPWIAEATVLKLYPGRLHIEIDEREAFALWQKDGKVTVISQDGSVVEPYVSRRFAKLPLVVGAGAESKAREFLAVLNEFPGVRDQVRASILVAERRWNLLLQNGITVRLPETEVEHALGTLWDLDRDKKLLTRDITVVDLRLPDRVTVRLSNEAAQVRLEALRAKPKKKGGSA